MGDITAPEIIRLIEVVLILLAAAVSVDKFADVVKKWREPAKSTARKLEEYDKILEDHGKTIGEMKESQRFLCSGVMALLDHELHNGNSEQMQKSRDDIMDFLSKNI